MNSTSTTKPRWALAGRALWVLLALAFLAAYAASIPTAFDQFSTPCEADKCELLRLHAEEVDILQDIGLSLNHYAVFQLGFQVVNTAIFLSLAALIYWRRSREWIGALVSLVLITSATFFFAPTVEHLEVAYPDLTVIVNLMLSLGLVLMTLFLYQFPDGRFVPRWTVVPTVIYAVGLLAAAAASDGVLFLTDSAVTSALYVLLFVVFGSGLVVQVYRYLRVSSPIERQQTKLVVLGVGVLITSVTVWTFAFELAPPSPGRSRLLLNFIGVGVIFLGLLMFPLSLATAILRYRLWDIDLLINRTLVYGALTASLAGVYFVGVVGFQAAFRAFTGQESSMAIVLSTLIIAALFVPLRRRIQYAIDRRFYRSRYDAERMLESFGATARDEVNLERLSGALVGAANETMRPTHASLWIRRT